MMIFVLIVLSISILVYLLLLLDSIISEDFTSCLICSILLVSAILALIFQSILI